MMGHARTKTATRTRANADTSDTSDEEDEGEDDALERMMRTKRRVAFADEVRGSGPEESGSDSETESVTTVGRAERLARNKPRALLKKGKLNARKKDVQAPVQSTNPLHLLDSDSDMDAIAEGDEKTRTMKITAAAAGLSARACSTFWTLRLSTTVPVRRLHVSFPRMMMTRMMTRMGGRRRLPRSRTGAPRRRVSKSRMPTRARI